MQQRWSFRLRPELLVFFITLLLPLALYSQDVEETESTPAADLDQIEAEIERGAPPQKKTEKAPEKETQDQEPQRLSDLSRLAPFSEVSVLQRRYMPKTERFQFSASLGGIANDPWFWGVGGNIRGAYHFNESWALEGTAMFLSSAERQAAKDLLDNNSVKTESIVSTKGYYGLDVMWSPIYGKMSLFNRRIVPFDMYFSAGLGMSQLEQSKSSSATTFHFGTGQIYALSKSLGFRWDFSVNNFSATSAAKNASASNFNNVILMFGMSYFFPEAKYR